MNIYNKLAIRYYIHDSFTKCWLYLVLFQKNSVYVKCGHFQQDKLKFLPSKFPFHLS